MQIKTNKNGVKLLAAVAIISMVVAVFAVVLPDGGDVDAEITYTEVSTSEGLKAELDKETKDIHVISDGILTLNEAGKYSVDNLKITPSGYALKLGDGVDLTINESLIGEMLASQIQLSNGSKLTVNGTISSVTIYGISDKTESIAGLGTFSSVDGNGFSTWVSENQMFITGNYSGWMMTNDAGLATVYVPESTSLIANEVFVGPGFDLVVYGEASGSFTTSAGSGGAPTDSKIAFQEKSTVGTAGLTIDGKGVLSGTITLDKNEKITLGENVKLDATVNGPSGNSLSGKLVAGADGLTIQGGSLTIDGSITTGSYDGVNITVSGDSIFIDGTIGQDVTITIAANTVVTIAADATLENNGSIINKGTIVVRADNQNLGVVDNKDGSINTPVGISVDGTITGSQPTPVGTEPGSFAMGDHLESDYTVVSYAFLTQDLTIPEGITLTVKGTLALNGFNLIVKGTLAVESKGKILGYESVPGTPNGIVLSETGAIENSGTIGADTFVIVKDEQQFPATATVTMKNVVGAEFGLTEVIYIDGVKKVKNVLTVSGETSKKGDASWLTINGAYIGDLVVGEIASVSITGTVTPDSTVTIGTKATVSNLTITMQNGATLTVDGKITAGTITMTNGSTVVLNGKVESAVVFQSRTGSFPTFKDGKRITAEEFTNTEDYVLIDSKVSLTNLIGITIEISTKAFVGGVDGKTQMTEQMMNVSGTATITKDENGVEENTATFTVTGKVYVAQGEALALLSDKMSLEGANATGDVIITNGTLSLAKALETVSGNKVSNIGTEYSVKTPTTTTPVTTYYYTTFDAAFSVIDTAEGKEVKINGDYEFDKNYTIATGQTVEFTTATISKDSKIIVQKDGTLSEGFKANGIKGILIVMVDGDCKPVDGSYEVKSADADGNITYSGAEVAIANAQSGTTIYIVNQVEFEDKVTVPQGVTVDVATTAEILVKNGLAVDGKILNKGTISMNKGDLDVTGEIDNKGTVDFNDSTNGHKVNVAGSITTDIPFGANSTINAATYENGVRTVYTTVASAMDAVSKMTLPVDITVTGKVSESSSITLVEGMKLVISGDVTLDSIRIVSGSTLDIDNGSETKLTADVIGAVGKADTTGAISDAVIGLSKVKNVDFTITYDESTTTYTMIASPAAEYAGSIIFKEGSVTINSAATTEFKFQNGETVRTLSVSEGATLVVKNNVKFTDDDGKGFSNAGKIESKAGMTFTTATIGGEVVVAVGKTVTFVGTITDATDEKPAEFNPVTIAGTITLSEKEGKDPANASIDGPVFIGTAPTTLGATGTLSGKVSFETDGFVIVFDGSTFSTTVEGVKSTAYMINGDAFAKIYGDAKIDVINPIVDDLEDLNVTCKKDTGTNKYTVYNIVWMNGSTKITDSDVGDYETVEATIGYNSVNVLISTAPGMLVYIDDFKVETEKMLTIGEHTITVYLQPDYTGTATISFNGQTVTNGKIVITTDMLGADQKLVVTGATPVEPSTPVIPVPTPTPSEKDDSMGITEYLLIVLVILAAILVVVVAIRMMRS